MRSNVARYYYGPMVSHVIRYYERANVLHVTSITNPLMDSRTYLVSCDPYADVVVIDPGNADISGVTCILEHRHWSPMWIFLTHEHFDHIAGVNQLKLRYPCRLACLRACAQNITQPKQNMSFFLDGVGFVCSPADCCYEDLKYSVPWHDYRIEFKCTPGHSPGSACVSVGSYLFTGDTLIPGYATITKFPGGDKVALKKSVGWIMESFNDDTVICPGHGPIMSLGEMNVELALGNRKQDSKEQNVRGM